MPEPAATLPALVAAQAAATPGATAVADDGGTLTYAELERRSAGLAARLRAAGAGPGTVVGVRYERSIEMVVAWLGVLRAGAAYLPLDPGNPPARLAFMLTDARVPLVLAAEPVPGFHTLTARPAHPGEEPGGDPEVPVAPEDLAYVIYTSGSTGTPKAAMLEHRNIVNTVRWYAGVMGLGPGVRAGQTVAAGFDVATAETWAALISGATLDIAPECVRAEPERLCAWITERGLEAAFLVTPIAQLALAHKWLLGSRLRVLATGGEKLFAPLAEVPFDLLNMYGPTEAAVMATWCEVDPADPDDPPIGRPLPGITATVRDPDGVPLPDGRTGELWLGGAGVGRGYLHRPELTAERFVEREGVRHYRTGDRCRVRPDGLITFVGRTDDQVKVRGFRVEPAEIEAVLRAHPAVIAAAVTVWEPGDGHRRLVAHLSGEADEEELRAWLSERLPAHMVPAVLVPVERMPLTSNQKIDRAALPDPAVHLARRESGLSGDPALAALGEDWRRACGVVAAGPGDRLVGLGAGSLDLLALRARVARRIGRPVPPRTLSLTQTLAEQARALAEPPAEQPGTTEEPAGPHPAPGQAADRRQHLLGSLGQEAIVFLEEVAGTAMGYQYQMLLDGPGGPDPERLRSALATVLRHQPALRCRWRLAEQGLTAEEADIAGVRLDEHVAGPGELPGLVDRLVGRPFHHDDFPLMGWDLIRHPGGTALLQREHHLVHDGWSVGVFLRLVQDAYDGVPLPTGGTDYFGWARRQRSRVSGPERAGAEAYWRAQLAGAARDRPRVPWPVEPERAGDRSLMTLQPLGDELSQRLRRTAAGLGVTAYTLLLAAFRRLVSEFQDRGDTVIGSATANRDVDTADTVGMFVNVLPLRRTTAPSDTAAGSARAELALLDSAARYEWLPTAEIVRMVSAGGGLRHTPLYQIMFSQHDAPQPRLRLGQWRPEVRELANGHGKTDLNVIVLNRGLQHARHGGSRRPGPYSLRWEHDPAMYPEPVVAALRDRYLDLLDHATRLPDVPWQPAHPTRGNGVTR